MEEDNKVIRRRKPPNIYNTLYKYYYEKDSQTRADIDSLEQIDPRFHKVVKEHIIQGNRPHTLSDITKLGSYREYADLNVSLRLIVGSYTHNKKVHQYDKMEDTEIKSDGSIKSGDKIWDSSQYSDFIVNTFFLRRCKERRDYIKDRFKNVNLTDISNIVNSNWDIRHIYPFNVFYTVYQDSAIIYQTWRVTDAIESLYCFLLSNQELTEATKFLEDIFLHGLTVEESAAKNEESTSKVELSIHLILNVMLQHKYFQMLLGKIDEDIF